MYSEKIMEEFYNPAHFENMRGASGVGKITCENGDEIIKIFVVVKNNKVVDASFQTFGGVVAIALSSFAIRFILDKSVEDARKISFKELLKMADDIPENRLYIAHAVVASTKMALDDALGLCEKKPEISEEEKELKRAKRLENKTKREEAPKEVDALELELAELRKTENEDEENEEDVEDEEVENNEIEILSELENPQKTNNNEVIVVPSNTIELSNNAVLETGSTNSSQIFHKTVTKKVVTRTTTNTNS